MKTSEKSGSRRIDQELIGRTLSAARRSRDKRGRRMSVQAIGERLDVSRQTVYGWMRGQSLPYAKASTRAAFARLCRDLHLYKLLDEWEI